MISRTGILIVLFTLIFGLGVKAQTVADLQGKWKFYFAMPDGTVLNAQTEAYFVSQFLENDKDEKLKSGEAFTEEDSLKAYAENKEIIKGLMSMEFTFKAASVCHVKLFMENQEREKNAKYKYYPTSKKVDILNETNEVGFTFTLKKEQNTVHLYFSGDTPFAFLTIMGVKAYFKKA